MIETILTELNKKFHKAYDKAEAINSDYERGKATAYRETIELINERRNKMDTCETCICYYEDKVMGGIIPYCEHINTPKEPLQDNIPCKYYLHKNIIKKYEDYGNLALQEEPVYQLIHQLIGQLDNQGEIE